MGPKLAAGTERSRPAAWKFLSGIVPEYLRPSGMGAQAGESPYGRAGKDQTGTNNLIGEITVIPIQSSPGVGPEMRAHRFKPCRKNVLTGEAQVGGRTRDSHIKKPLKQVRYPPGETINAYKKDGLEFQSLYVLYVEYANLASIADNTSFGGVMFLIS